MKHLIIDVETLGIADNSVVLQVVAGIHDTENREDFINKFTVKSWKLSAKKQTEKGRVIERGSLEFWKQQPHEVQVEAFLPHKNDMDAEAAMTEFEEFLTEQGFNPKKDFVWQRGSKDESWINNLMLDCGWIFFNLPIKFYRVRDIRTCVDVLGQSSKLNGYPDNVDELRASVPDYKQHDAVSDVRLELVILRECGIL